MARFIQNLVVPTGAIVSNVVSLENAFSFSIQSPASVGGKTVTPEVSNDKVTWSPLFDAEAAQIALGNGEMMVQDASWAWVRISINTANGADLRFALAMVEM